MDHMPCLEARIVGGAFVHEQWGLLENARLIALCDSEWTALHLCRELASHAHLEDARRWIITDARGGDQQIWTRARVDAERAKQEQSS